MTSRTSTFFRKQRLWIVVLLVVILVALLVIGVMYLIMPSKSALLEQFSHYRALSLLEEDTANLPAASNNPVRQDLNTVLSQTLVKKMTNAERLSLAEHGLELLHDSQVQIDAIGDTANSADAELARIEKGSELGNNAGLKSRTARIIELAKKRSSIIADIRGLSYRTDFDIGEIFKHIIAAKGALPDSYMSELNNSIPAVEEQFNKRSNLYIDMQDTSAQIDAVFEEQDGFLSALFSN